MIGTRLDDSDPIKWTYHTQTEKKHNILKAYLDAWYPILGSWNDRLVVVDGFAGRATYTARRDMAGDDCQGSPLIMLESLLNHRMFKNRTPPHYNHKLLEKAIHEFEPRRTSMPTDVSIEIHISDRKFEDISENGIEKYVINAPFDDINQATFLFVDPFGFTGFPMESLARLCRPRKGHKVELFLNFMIESISRSALSLSQKTNMTELFGMSPTQWGEFRDETFAKDPKAGYLLELYVKQLRSHAQFEATHILSLEMKRENQSTIYYLIYATRHWKGVKCMKDALWKVDPKAVQQLLTPDETLEMVLVKYFKKGQSGKQFKLEDIEEFVALHTNFNTTVKGALRSLEKAGYIRFRGERPRNYVYPEGSFVTFTGIPFTRKQRPQKQLTIPSLFNATKSSLNTKRKAKELENDGEDATRPLRPVYPAANINNIGLTVTS